MEQLKEYEKRRAYFQKLVKKQDKSIALISNIRLLIFLVGVVATVFFYLIKNYYLCLGVFLGFVIIFAFLVKKHDRVIKSRKYSLSLCKINDISANRLEGKWMEFKDTGEDFIDEEHNYAWDLDVFGRGSIFQWINTAVTFLGRQRLSQVLKNPANSIDEIYKRQEAIEELAEKLDWRQAFNTEGMIASEKMQDTEDLFKWGQEEKGLYCNELLSLILKLVPLFTIGLIILPFITDKVPYYVSSVGVVINILILMWGNEERSRSLSTIDKYRDSIKAYEGMVKTIEKEKFNCKYLKDLKNNLIDNKGNIASNQINKLRNISEMTAWRRSSYYFIVNLITLWDYHCMFSLEKWKRASGKNLQGWIKAIAELEALASLAIIKYDNPHWTMPKIIENSSNIYAKSMGHPLLRGDRVCNDFKLEKPSTIVLITGSNMSGKSTFLRTVGINLVLGYAGAPVCAESFICPKMNIYTCMRVSDNLEKNISSFYAELLRIKKIVEATKSEKQVFFLLDEIFKGTNSLDRHTGAKILINKLRQEKALGLVSTHDLELGELEKESGGKIKNYHFREFYANEKIQFDYKLRSGVSNTRNALYLIKMIGIDA